LIICRKKYGLKKIIVGFEGLASYKVGFLRNGLIKPVLRTLYQQDIIFKSYPYNHVSRAIKEIREIIQGNYLIFIGHSYGADAVSDVIAAGIHPNVVITCDPRKRWDPFRMKKFVKPSMVSTLWFNYFQHWEFGLMGYKVHEADLNQNIGFCLHTRVPKKNEIHQKLIEILQM